MRSGLFLPLFDQLADPALVARLAGEAEEVGWRGVFVWDHVRWREPVVEVADPWITLAAIATATAGVRLGPMVSRLARRRPVKVARETATLDRLSGGRLTFGSASAATSSEASTRLRARARRQAARADARRIAGDPGGRMVGEPVHHRGEHYTVDGMRFLPRPVQRPGVPVWVAGFYGKPRPLRRAARHQGFFPVNLEHPEQLAEISPSSPCCVSRRARSPLSPTMSSRRCRLGRSGALCRGGGHVVGGGLPGGCGVGGSGARGDPRRTIRPRRSDAICGLTRAAAPS